LQTHFELLKSHEVRRKAADLLDLAKYPEYRVRSSRLKEMINAIKHTFSSMLGLYQDSSDPSAQEAKERPEIDLFRQHTRVLPLRGSRVVNLTVESQDPEFAAKAANTLASVYIDHVLELKASIKEKASKWFSTHLEELRRKVEESEYNLYAYRSRYGLMDAHERQMVTAQQLSELNSELVKAEMKRVDTQARYQQVASILRRHPDQAEDWAFLDDATEVLNSHLIQVLRTEEIKASAKLAELADKYGPLHPKMTHAQSELLDLRLRIQNEVQKIYNSLNHEYETAVARVKVIREAVERHKQEKVKLEQHEVEHAILDREAQSNRQLYDTFLKQMKETNLTSGMLMSNIYLADPAVPSPRPLKPRTKLNIILGLLAGLVGGIGLAIVLDYLDHSLKGPDDVERYLPRLPLLGIVPIQPNGHRWGGKLLPNYGAGMANGYYSIDEHYRTVRTNILLSSSHRRSSSLLITSPGENEGKTTVAVNLAMAMAQLEGLQVVLIDADLRTPGTRSLLGLQRDGAKGLAHFLMGQADFQEVIYPTEVTNLWILPYGIVPSNPSELLHSKRMMTLLERLSQNGFQVIIDAPSMRQVADSMILGVQVEGVLLVISAGETSREACRLAVHRVASCGAKLIGVVLQKARPPRLAMLFGQPHVARA
jgi:succinoglycan biosynthesis transport protein ExoP